MNTIGSRIALIRGDKSRAAFARVLGCHKNTLGNYERGERSPDAAFLVKMVQIGVNTHWVLTGEGPRYLGANAADEHGSMVRDGPEGRDYEAQERKDRGRIVGERVRRVLQEIDAALTELQLFLSTDRKAELASVIIELYMDTDTMPRREHIVRLARTFLDRLNSGSSR